MKKRLMVCLDSEGETPVFFAYSRHAVVLMALKGGPHLRVKKGQSLCPVSVHKTRWGSLRLAGTNRDQLGFKALSWMLFSGQERPLKWCFPAFVLSSVS